MIRSRLRRLEQQIRPHDPVVILVGYKGYDRPQACVDQLVAAATEEQGERDFYVVYLQRDSRCLACGQIHRENENERRKEYE